MQSPRYALVAYVNDPIAGLIRQIRQELHPDLPHLAAHVTLLPPRILKGTESSALTAIENICRHLEPFDVNLGEVETFIPVTPTVFIRVTHAYRIRELHAQLSSTEPFSVPEEWVYLPHMTIVKMSTEAQAQEAYLLARHRWTEFEGSRCIGVKELTFVREEADNRWADVAALPLGSAMVLPRNR
jgi:hypothetical protein